MARHKEAPFYLRSKDGRAILDFTDVEGKRTKVALGLPFDRHRSGPEETRAAQRAAEAEWRRLTDGRIVEADRRILTTATLAELYLEFEKRFAPDPNADENARRRANATYLNRKTYGANIVDWANNEATRPDGSKRWRGDARTPLQRLVAETGPTDFLAWRLLKVVRKTMRKEKSNLVAFLDWAKAAGYLANVPPVELPAGKGTRAAKPSGRGVHVPLSALEARMLVAAMPVWSSRAARNGGKPFEVRSFFEFLWLTGLRPVTIMRLEISRSWKRGDVALALANEDDKALYGRSFPLTKMQIEVLERVVGDRTDGHVWGHHDYRRYPKLAAAIVFKDDPVRRERFGSYHLRHFVGTFLANRAGTNLPAAQYVLGHLDLTTTSTYVHGDEDAARALLEGAERELRSAARKADAWARRQALAADSVPIRSRSAARSAAFPVGASGFEPPTLRPPAQAKAEKARVNRGR